MKEAGPPPFFFACYGGGRLSTTPVVGCFKNRFSPSGDRSGVFQEMDGVITSHSTIPVAEGGIHTSFTRSRILRGRPLRFKVGPVNGVKYPSCFCSVPERLSGILG